MLLLERRSVSPAPHNHRLLQACKKGRERSREGACWGRGSEWLNDGVPVQRGEQDVGGLGQGPKAQRPDTTGRRNALLRMGTKIRTRAYSRTACRPW